MATVQDVLDHKGNNVYRMDESVNVAEAAAFMHEKRIGAVLLFKEGRLTGIFSERDVTRKVVGKGLVPTELSVSEVMTRNVICVRPTMTMNECMDLMGEKIIRHLPVLEENNVVGMISVFDVVRNLIGEQRAAIRQLESDVLVANQNLRAFLM